MPTSRRARPTRSVFVNCPFDPDYKALFNALVFAVHDCVFVARCALEFSDSGQLRFQKICQLIRECRYGIHDLSRTQLDPEHQLPRFNMPLELGLFLGAREFGEPRRHQKACLVLDTHKYRYQVFCSDLAGVDIEAHDNRPSKLVGAACDWLQVQANQYGSLRRREPEILPDGKVIFERYEAFLEELPALCRAKRRDPRTLIFPVYVALVESRLLANPWQPDA
jgi:hypothetical protein